MSIHMIGIDHTTADVDTRAIFAFTKKRSEEIMREWLELPGIYGAIVLSTCNRMEVWLSVQEEWDGSLLSMVCEEKKVKEEQYRDCFSLRSDHEAIEHLFWLTCGLKSQILAEDQILTQIKNALALSRENETTDSVLEVLFRRAVTAAKRVKTEVAFSRANETAVDQAIYMLRHQGFPFDQAVCMVVGNGEMGKLAAQSLQQTGADVTVTIRQYRSGVVEIPQGCSRINYGERLDFLPECDLVVSATASPNYTFTEAQVREAKSLHRKRPLIFIDLAVPRDVEPAVGEMDNIILYDIDDFKAGKMTESVKRSMEQSGVILQEEIDEFYGWLDSRKVLPLILDLKDHAMDDFDFRVHKAIGKLPLENKEREQLQTTVDTAAGKVVAKLLFCLRESLGKEEFQRCLESLDEMYHGEC